MSVHPLSIPLPTGQELMSGPIKSGGPTRQEKEIEFVMKNIDGRLDALEADESYEVKKVIVFFIAVFMAMGGVTLILFGLHRTFFFQKYKQNIPALVFGSLMCCPVFYWFWFVFIPSKRQRRMRKKMHSDRRDRRKPTLFNQLVEEAKKATEPPPRRIRVLAHIRKHDYPIVASTMQEFVDAVHSQCGLSVERQLLRHGEKDLEIILDKKLDEHYQLDDNDRIHVYNKGGYFTKDSPLKRTRMDIFSMNEIVGGEGSQDGSKPNTPNPGNRTSMQPGRTSMGGIKSAMSNSEGKESRGNSMNFGRESIGRDSIGRDSVNENKRNVSFKS